MRAISLLYHDVIEEDDWDSSGFPGSAAAKYKLARQDFEAHVSAAAKAHPSRAVTAYDVVSENFSGAPLLVTFDDGGSSAISPVADLLEARGWRAHFFITVNQIGKRGFMSAAQVRELHQRGHVIGSHSLSHPTRMASCDDETLANEWTKSVEALAQLIGEQVDTASVPGGYYSRRVAEAAAAAHIKILFNSEPTTKIVRVRDCLVFGRFTVVRGMPSRVSAQLASADRTTLSRQWIFWNLKKIAKRGAGTHYLTARRYLLGR